MPVEGPGQARQPDPNRIESELKQLRTAIEAAQVEALALAAERDGLSNELARRTAQLHEAELRLRRRDEAAHAARDALLHSDHAASVRSSEHASTAEELRVAVEELQVLAEELESTNTALNRANASLESRVVKRTADLASLNQQLRDSEERLRLAQKFAEAGAWDWDIPADTIKWSPEYFALYGLDPDLVQPSYESWLASVAPMDRSMAEATLQDCLRRGIEDFRVEYRILHPQRGERWLAGRGRLIHDERRNPVRMIGLNIDITDRKRAELALEQANETLRREMDREVRARETVQAQLFQTMKLEALGQLTGGVAHDFNNLLSVIMSGAALLRKEMPAGRRDRLLNAMTQAAQRGADLTRRLLTFARRQSLRPAPLDLRAWLFEMRELLARTLRGDIAIEVSASEDLWPVLVDAGELELAVLNLAVNARDAMPRSGTLRLAAENAVLEGWDEAGPLQGDFLRLTVQDTGDGMPPEVLARAFEPFFSTKEVGQGTGLGLAQVYGFARQSGGAVRVASTPGAGTTVTLLLPRAAASPQADEGARAIAVTDSARPLRILLVEDDDAVAALTVEALEHLGHRPVRVASGMAALRALDGGAPIDLVLTDVVMPGGQDGLELARQLLAARPELPVLLYSGYGGAPARVAAAGLPLLRKPFSLDELGRALLQARAGARRERA